MIRSAYRVLCPSPIRKSINEYRLFRSVVSALRNVEDLRYAKQVLSSLNGLHPRYCNICGYSGLFRAKSIPMKIDAHCPRCKSVGKHRLLWKIISESEVIDRGSRLLHFAPEPGLFDVLSQITSDYRTADYLREDVDLRINIEDIDLPNQSIDVVICNHVLEHVDHRKAICELHRILAPGGRAFLTIPIIWEWEETYENDRVDSDVDREIHFGQFDHLRYFGRDFVATLTESGFEVRDYMASGKDCVKYGLLRGEKVFVAEKLRRE